MPYIKNLGVLGIDASVRMVDPVQQQYARRTTSTSTLRSSASASRPCREIRCDPISRQRSAATKGSQQSGRNFRSGHRRTGRPDRCRQYPSRNGDRLPGAGPGDPVRALLGAALVQGVALDRLLGHVRPPSPGQAKICPRHSGNLVVQSRKGRQTGAQDLDFTGGSASEPRWVRAMVRSSPGRLRRPPSPTGHEGSNQRANMGAYIIRRVLLMIPTLFGIMLVSFAVVQFAPGGPVERVIAQLSGSDTGATSRISGSPGGDFGPRGGAEGASGGGRRIVEISRRPGARSGIHQAARKAVRLRQAGL